MNIDIVENVLRPLKTESISKLSNSKIPWTKTLNEDNFHHIAFFFTFFKGYRRIKLVIGNNTQRKFLMGARENKFQISQNDILHTKFSEFYLCFHILCEI